MKEFVAVNHPIIATNVSVLKQQALMFNRIAIPNLTAFIKNEKMQEVARDLQWLLESNIVFEPILTATAKISLDEYRHNLDGAVQHAKKILSLFGFGVDELIEARENKEKSSALRKRLDQMPAKLQQGFLKPEVLVEHVRDLATFYTRLFSIQLRELEGLEAYPILPADIPQSQTREDTRAEIIKIVLAALPVPDGKTSWERIIEYRSDPASLDKFLDLRNWMSEVARGELTPDEVGEKLEYLLSRYRRHMEIHRMKTNTTALETFVVTTADVLGNISRFQWGKAAQALFSFKHRKVDLLEGELTVQGNEVAYIIKARDVFS